MDTKFLVYNISEQELATSLIDAVEIGIDPSGRKTESKRDAHNTADASPFPQVQRLTSFLRVSTLVTTPLNDRSVNTTSNAAINSFGLPNSTPQSSRDVCHLQGDIGDRLESRSQSNYAQDTFSCVGHRLEDHEVTARSTGKLYPSVESVLQVLEEFVNTEPCVRLQNLVRKASCEAKTCCTIAAEAYVWAVHRRICIMLDMLCRAKLNCVLVHDEGSETAEAMEFEGLDERDSRSHSRENTSVGKASVWKRKVDFVEAVTLLARFGKNYGVALADASLIYDEEFYGVFLPSLTALCSQTIYLVLQPQVKALLNRLEVISPGKVEKSYGDASHSGVQTMTRTHEGSSGNLFDGLMSFRKTSRLSSYDGIDTYLRAGFLQHDENSISVCGHGIRAAARRNQEIGHVTIDDSKVSSSSAENSLPFVSEAFQLLQNEEMRQYSASVFLEEIVPEVSEFKHRKSAAEHHVLNGTSRFHFIDSASADHSSSYGPNSDMFTRQAYDVEMSNCAVSAAGSAKKHDCRFPFTTGPIDLFSLIDKALSLYGQHDFVVLALAQIIEKYCALISETAKTESQQYNQRSLSAQATFEETKAQRECQSPYVQDSKEQNDCISRDPNTDGHSGDRQSLLRLSPWATAQQEVFLEKIAAFLNDIGRLASSSLHKEAVVLQAFDDSDNESVTEDGETADPAVNRDRAFGISFEGTMNTLMKKLNMDIQSDSLVSCNATTPNKGPKRRRGLTRSVWEQAVMDGIPLDDYCDEIPHSSRHHAYVPAIPEMQVSRIDAHHERITRQLRTSPESRRNTVFGTLEQASTGEKKQLWKIMKKRLKHGREKSDISSVLRNSSFYSITKKENESGVKVRSSCKEHSSNFLVSRTNSRSTDFDGVAVNRNECKVGNCDILPDFAASTDSASDNTFMRELSSPLDEQGSFVTRTVFALRVLSRTLTKQICDHIGSLIHPLQTLALQRWLPPKVPFGGTDNCSYVRLKENHRQDADQGRSSPGEHRKHRFMSSCTNSKTGDAEMAGGTGCGRLLYTRGYDAMNFTDNERGLHTVEDVKIYEGIMGTQALSREQKVILERGLSPPSGVDTHIQKRQGSSEITSVCHPVAQASLPRMARTLSARKEIAQKAPTQVICSCARCRAASSKEGVSLDKVLREVRSALCFFRKRIKAKSIFREIVAFAWDEITKAFLCAVIDFASELKRREDALRRNIPELVTTISSANSDIESASLKETSQPNILHVGEIAAEKDDFSGNHQFENENICRTPPTKISHVQRSDVEDCRSFEDKADSGIRRSVSYGSGLHQMEPAKEQEDIFSKLGANCGSSAGCTTNSLFPNPADLSPVRIGDRSPQSKILENTQQSNTTPSSVLYDTLPATVVDEPSLHEGGKSLCALKIHDTSTSCTSHMSTSTSSGMGNADACLSYCLGHDDVRSSPFVTAAEQGGDRPLRDTTSEPGMPTLHAQISHMAQVERCPSGNAPQPKMRTSGRKKKPMIYVGPWGSTVSIANYKKKTNKDQRDSEVRSRKKLFEKMSREVHHSDGKKPQQAIVVKTSQSDLSNDTIVNLSNGTGGATAVASTITTQRTENVAYVSEAHHPITCSSNIETFAQGLDPVQDEAVLPPLVGIRQERILAKQQTAAVAKIGKCSLASESNMDTPSSVPQRDAVSSSDGSIVCQVPSIAENDQDQNETKTGQDAVCAACLSKELASFRYAALAAEVKARVDIVFRAEYFYAMDSQPIASISNHQFPQSAEHVRQRTEYESRIELWAFLLEEIVKAQNQALSVQQRDHLFEEIANRSRWAQEEIICRSTHRSRTEYYEIHSSPERHENLNFRREKNQNLLESSKCGSFSEALALMCITCSSTVDSASAFQRETTKEAYSNSNAHMAGEATPNPDHPNKEDPFNLLECETLVSRLLLSNAVAANVFMKSGLERPSRKNINQLNSELCISPKSSKRTDTECHSAERIPVDCVREGSIATLKRAVHERKTICRRSEVESTPDASRYSCPDKILGTPDKQRGRTTLRAPCTEKKESNAHPTIGRIDIPLRTCIWDEDTNLSGTVSGCEPSPHGVPGEHTILGSTKKEPLIDFLDTGRRFGGWEALSLYSMKWRRVDILEVIKNQRGEPEEQLVRVHYRGFNVDHDELIADCPGKLQVRLRHTVDPHFVYGAENNVPDPTLLDLGLDYTRLYNLPVTKEPIPKALAMIQRELKNQLKRSEYRGDDNFGSAPHRWRFVLPRVTVGNFSTLFYSWQSQAFPMQGNDNCYENLTPSASHARVCDQDANGTQAPGRDPAVRSRRSRRWSRQLDDLVRMFH